MIRDLAMFLLRLSAKAVLKKYKPRIIAITGSVGKTTVKEAIFQVVSGSFRARRSIGNYNNEIGLPLAILGAETGKRSIGAWIRILLRFFMLMRGVSYPEVLVLEMGADRPGDIKYLCGIARPDVAVVTRVGSAHTEFFHDLDAVQMEKSNIVEAMGPGGVAVLNADDPRVLAIKTQSRGRVITYGITQGNIRAENIEIKQEMSSGIAHPAEGLGLSWDIAEDGNLRRIYARGLLGMPQVYALLAAYAAARALDIEADKILPALRKFVPPPGRLRPIAGIHRSILLDDTYNASPEAVVESLKALAAVRGGRKIAVLGDMRELGAGSAAQHRRIGRLVGDLGVDLLYTVGKEAKFIADEARARGFAKKKVREYIDAQIAGKELAGVVVPGDIVLIKGSRKMGMERIVAAVMAEPERAGELLVHSDI